MNISQEWAAFEKKAGGGIANIPAHLGITRRRYMSLRGKGKIPIKWYRKLELPVPTGRLLIKNPQNDFDRFWNMAVLQKQVATIVGLAKMLGVSHASVYDARKKGVVPAEWEQSLKKTVGPGKVISVGPSVRPLPHSGSPKTDFEAFCVWVRYSCAIRTFGELAAALNVRPLAVFSAEKKDEIPSEWFQRLGLETWDEASREEMLDSVNPHESGVENVARAPAIAR